MSWWEGVVWEHLSFYSDPSLKLLSVQAVSIKISPFFEIKTNVPAIVTRPPLESLMYHVYNDQYTQKVRLKCI